MVWSFFFIGFFFYGGALALRHYWFQTSAWDLGIFNQAIYLISQGLPPQSSLLGFHILGDHGALVLYPLGWLAAFIPSLKLLFVLQAAALSSAVFPLARLAKQQSLSKKATSASLFMVLLYPVIFNTAIFDFHPEVFAFPLLMEALVNLENPQQLSNVRAVLCLLFALTCKVSISLLVLGIGIWLLLKKRRAIGICLCLLATLWLIVIGTWLIPAYGGESAQLTRHIGKFGLDPSSDIHLNNLVNIIMQLASQFFSIVNVEYILLVILPVAYLMIHSSRLKLLFYLLPFTPLMLLNLLSADAALKDLVHHYSLLLVPFLAIAVQKTLSPQPNGLLGYPAFFSRKAPLFIICWSIVTFLALSRFTFFFGPFQQTLDTSKERYEAIALAGKDTAILTSNNLVPHLSSRKIIDFTTEKQITNINQFEQILLDTKYPGWGSSDGLVKQIVKLVNEDPNWSIIFQKKSVLLYEKFK